MAYDWAFLFPFGYQITKKKSSFALFWLYKTAISLHLSVTHFHGFVHVASGIHLSLFIWKLLFILYNLSHVSSRKSFLKDKFFERSSCTPDYMYINLIQLFHGIISLKCLKGKTLHLLQLWGTCILAAEHSRYLYIHWIHCFWAQFSWN